MTIPDGAIAELKSRHSCADTAAQWVRLRRQGAKLVGPCPICSDNPQSKTAARFEADADKWVCAVCPDGGDVIRLVQMVMNLEFRAAVDWLGGARDLDPAVGRKLVEDRAKKRARSERDAAEYRERERGNVFKIWQRGAPVFDVAAAKAYFDKRALQLPAGAHLRAIEALPYYASGAKDAAEIHRGPAMLAAILGREGKFSGLHVTWLDPLTRSGKAELKDPETGAPLPAKKVRGSKSGGRIILNAPKTLNRMIIGEGIETVLSAWRALKECERDLTSTLFASAVDLGNLGGRALETVPHPTLKKGNRAQRVPGPVPDPEAFGIPVAPAIGEIVILGDSDSDRFTTQCAIARAAARWARPGLIVRVAFAPDGQDFNDMLRSPPA